MSTKSEEFTILPGVWTGPTDATERVKSLEDRYARWSSLLSAQPEAVQRQVEQQALQLANALADGERRASFTLPDQLITELGAKAGSPIPASRRFYQVRHSLWLKHADLTTTLRLRFDQLEADLDEAVGAAAGLLRFATARALVQTILPDGKPDALEARPQKDSAGEVEVPFTSAARHSFMPQWVALDEADRLICASLAEAEGSLAAMQRYLQILKIASELAPAITADEQYQRKRFGMLGQLQNQGRALARYETARIIALIQQRAAEQRLNRGLHLNLPYFDSQTLGMKIHSFEVIPTGWILFVPAFVVLAAQREMKNVEGNSRLDHATRQHLLVELQMLAVAFHNPDQAKPVPHIR